MSQDPSLEEVIDAALDERLEHVYTAMPGRVESYDPEDQKADVQPLVFGARISESGDRVAERMPVVQGVPVMFPGAGDFSITFPIEEGTTGLLIFTYASLDVWLNKGGEVDPVNDRRHSLADAVFIPGLRPFSSPITPEPEEDALVVNAARIKLGSNDADDPVALKSDLEEIKPALVGAIDAQITVLTPGLPGTADQIAELTALKLKIESGVWPVCAQKVDAE